MRDGDGDGDDGGDDGDGDGDGKLYGDGDAACRVCDARAQDAFAVPLLPPSFSFIFVAAAAAAAAFLMAATGCMHVSPASPRFHLLRAGRA